MTLVRLLMGLGLALPVTLAWAADPVAAPSAMAAASDTVVFAQADGRPVDDLASLTGQSGNLTDQVRFVSNQADLEASVGNGQFSHVVTGLNQIATGGLAGMNGIGTVVQNSGNQVVIQNSTILNVSLF